MPLIAFTFDQQVWFNVTQQQNSSITKNSVGPLDIQSVVYQTLFHQHNQCQRWYSILTRLLPSSVVLKLGCSLSWESPGTLAKATCFFVYVAASNLKQCQEYLGGSIWMVGFCRKVTWRPVVFGVRDLTSGDPRRYFESLFAWANIRFSDDFKCFESHRFSTWVWSIYPIIKSRTSWSIGEQRSCCLNLLTQSTTPLRVTAALFPISVKKVSSLIPSPTISLRAVENWYTAPGPSSNQVTNSK